MRRAALVAASLLVGACGRLGYDARELADDAAPLLGPDGGPVPDYCGAVPALANAPVIDGTAEPGLSLQPLAPAAWNGQAGGPPAGQSASYALAWRPDGLYVYVQVVDPTRVPAPDSQFNWCGDAVEIYVDADGSYGAPPAYDDPGTRQIVIGAPADAQTARRGAQAWCPTCGDTVPRVLADTNLVASPRPDGYTVEALITAPDLGLGNWTRAAGEQLGFDLAVNVSTDAPTADACIYDGSSRGSQLGQYFLAVNVGALVYPFDTVDAFCNPTLTAPP